MADLKPGARELLRQVFEQAKQEAGIPHYLSPRARRLILWLGVAASCAAMMALLFFFNVHNLNARLQAPEQVLKEQAAQRQLIYGLRDPGPQEVGPGEQAGPALKNWSRDNEVRP